LNWIVKIDSFNKEWDVNALEKLSSKKEKKWLFLAKMKKFFANCYMKCAKPRTPFSWPKKFLHDFGC
jgi:predicted HicB family RNase H-like nuclease